MTDDVYAATVSVSIPTGTSVPGCEQTNSCFLPSSVSINVGDTVIWTNGDTVAHTVTSGSPTGGPDGTFDSSLFMFGANYLVTFLQAGTYPYYCAVHPWMQGEVNVQGAPSIEYYSLQVSVSPSTVLEDEIAVISGQLYASQYISGYEVSVQFETDTGLSGGGWVLDGGQFNVNVQWPVGVHTITYYFESDAGTLVSNPVVLTVRSPEGLGTSISLDPFTSSITVDDTLFLSGRLTTGGGVPIYSKTIWIQADSDNGRGVGGSAITDSGGYFTRELGFSEYDVANWTVYAKFDGDSEYKKSSSTARLLTVTSAAPTPPPPAPAGTDVQITLGAGVPGCEDTNSCFSPYTISVDVGDTVTWYNADTAAHTVTSGTAAGGPDGVFDSSLFMSGASFSHTFSQAGTYPYFAMNTPWVSGVVIVNEEIVQESISVSTDRTSYQSGDNIFVTGQTTVIDIGVTILVTSPNGSIISVDQVYPSSSGTFSTQLSTAGTLWEQTGTYRIAVQQGTTNSASTTFYFENTTTPPLICGPDQIIVGGECVDAFSQSVIAWDKPSYKICDVGEITFNGQEENTNPNLIQIFFIQVTSDSDPVGIEVIMVETGNDTGIFTGQVRFCDDMNVSEGDKVYVSYGNMGDTATIESSTITSAISVTTDRSSYTDGGTIIISGQVSEILPGFPVTLQVIGADGNLMTLVQIDVGADGMFSIVLGAGGPLWESSGTYTINVLYGTEARTAQATFSFTTSGLVIPPPRPAGIDVEITLGSAVPGCEQTNSCYSPYTISVDVGDTVMWYNADTAAHTVTSGSAAEGPSGVFDSNMLMSGKTFEVTFSQAGTYPYFDMLHPWVAGTVIVKGKTTSQSDAGTLRINDYRFTISKYNPAEVILSGEVTAYNKGTPVLLQLIFPDGSVVEQKILVSSDKNFGVTIFLDDTYPTGSYTITAQYNSIDFVPISFQAVAEDDTEPSVQYYSLTASVSPSTVVHGEIAVISGTLYASQYIPGYEISVTFETDTGLSGGTWILDGGQFNVNVDWPAGVHTITYYFDSDAGTLVSNPIVLTVRSLDLGIDVEIPSGSGVPGCEDTNSCWIPSTISVDVGDTVTWYNADTAAHTVTSGTAADGPDGVFDSSMLMSGSTFEVTFYQDGTYPYFCMLHPWQAGTVIVGDGGTIAPTFSVFTDRTSYSDGDTIRISGDVGTLNENVSVTILIIDPVGDIVSVSQITPNFAGDFSHSIISGGAMVESGTYEVRAQYGTQKTSTTFSFTAVPKISASVLVLDPLPSKVNREDIVLMTGRLQTESGIPITFRTVNLVSDNNGQVASSTTTDSIGQFAFNWNVKYSYTTYRWYVEFIGDDQFTPSNSAVQSVSITLQPELYFTPLPNRVDVGTTLTFSGQLTAEGLALAGKTVYIKDDVTLGTDTLIGSVTTDQNGEFSATWDAVPRSSGAYDFYAVFEGDSEALRVRSATYSVYVTVTQVFEPIRVYTEKTIFSEGDSLRVYGSATPNEELEIALMDSRKNIITQKSIRVDSTGSFSTVLFTWQSSFNVNFGDYGVVAWSPIDMRYDGLWVSFIKLEPETYQTKITLNRPQASVIIGQPITFTGQLLTVNGESLSGQLIGIGTKIGGNLVNLENGYTDSSGRFSINWNTQYLSSSATIPVFAFYIGNQIFKTSISDGYNITIEKPILSVSTSATEFKPGDSIAVYGDGTPGDRISVSIRSNSGQVVASEIVSVSSDGSYFVILFLSSALSDGTYTVTASSSNFNISDSTQINVTAKIPETISIRGNAYYRGIISHNDLSGLKTVLTIGQNYQIDYTDSSGNFEFNNIRFDPNVDYSLWFEMTDGKSFNLVDTRKYNSNANAKVIQSYLQPLYLDKTKTINYYSFNLNKILPYDSGNSNIINKAFSIQTKISNFYSRVLGERPPIINIFLFETGNYSYYQPVRWDPNTGQVLGPNQPKIVILKYSGTIRTLGMEYTHYVQDFAYHKVYGFDSRPMKGNHYGFNNPSTADSWIEGVGSFMPGVIAQWASMDGAGKFGSIILEDNKYFPNTIHEKSPDPMSKTWLDEEYAISNLLWDLYDNANDGENISMSKGQVWSLIKGFDSFQRHNPDYDYYSGDRRHIKYFKDLYDYISDNSNIPQNEIDSIFILHGIPEGIHHDPNRPGRV